MKRFVSAALLVFSPALFAQNRTPAPPAGSGGISTLDLTMERAQGSQSQAGCPVVFTTAQLTAPRGSILPVSAETMLAPNLDLHFRNASGKSIQTVEITVALTGKTDVYQLDATSFVFHLSFSGAEAVSGATEQLRQIRLPEKMYPYGVTRVELERVAFADGSAWTAGSHSNCRLNSAGSERIAK